MNEKKRSAQLRRGEIDGLITQAERLVHVARTNKDALAENRALRELRDFLRERNDLEAKLQTRTDAQWEQLG